jgi:hypothetical protein
VLRDRQVPEEPHEEGLTTAWIAPRSMSSPSSAVTKSQRIPRAAFASFIPNHWIQDPPGNEIFHSL